MEMLEVLLKVPSRIGQKFELNSSKVIFRITDRGSRFAVRFVLMSEDILSGGIRFRCRLSGTRSFVIVVFINANLLKYLLQVIFRYKCQASLKGSIRCSFESECQASLKGRCKAFPWKWVACVLERKCKVLLFEMCF